MEQLLESIHRIEGKVDDMATDVTNVRLSMAILPCPVMHDRVDRLQKVVYGAVAVVLIGALGATGTAVFKSPKQTIIYQRAPVTSGGVSSGTQIANITMPIEEEECK